MKMRKVIDLCKNSRMLRLYEHEGVQWISDGSALYPLWGMPALTPEGLCTAYDITDKQWEKIQFVHEYDGIPKTIETADIIDGEVAAIRAPMWIRWSGMSLVPFKVSTGVEWVDAAYLTPFEKDERLELFERRMPSGRLYFAVKVGFELVGILSPEKLPTKQLTEDIEILARQCRLTLENTREEPPEDEPEQMGLEDT